MQKIYLIPNTLGETSLEKSFPPYNLEIIKSIQHFAVESEKSARKFLKSCGILPPFSGISLYVLDKRTKADELNKIFESSQGGDIGILSEAGCPGIADPGSNLVLAAYQRDWKVIPLVGPSSILLAIMASGLNGQGFTFHGYLPVSGNERLITLRALENNSAESGNTEIFIETPFRNEHLFNDILKACKQNTLLSIACDITLPTEEIRTLSIEQWRKMKVDLKGRQAIFSLLAGRAKYRK